MPATLHVIFGPIGAGKTTYAHALARREGAVPFVLDEWGARLFGPDVRPNHEVSRPRLVPGVSTLRGALEGGCATGEARRKHDHEAEMS